MSCTNYLQIQFFFHVQVFYLIAGEFPDNILLCDRSLPVIFVISPKLHCLNTVNTSVTVKKPDSNRASIYIRTSGTPDRTRTCYLLIGRKSFKIFLLLFSNPVTINIGYFCSDIIIIVIPMSM